MGTAAETAEGFLTPASRPVSSYPRPLDDTSEAEPPHPDYALEVPPQAPMAVCSLVGAFWSGFFLP